MYEIVWQYNDTEPFEDVIPVDAADARRLLIEGNQSFAGLFATPRRSAEAVRQVVRVSPQDVGISARPGEPPPQVPFAAFLSCADARVPVELIFGQQANDLFVVRVAGNVLGDECLGSLDFAVDQLGTVRLLGVLGHTGCGAVTAAVDAYLYPAGYLSVASNFPLQSIISRLMGPVRGAALALSSAHGEDVAEAPGYRAALIDLSVMLNASLSAAVLAQAFHEALGPRLQVSFGVYDLLRRTVGLPDLDGGTSDWQAGLVDPPRDQVAFEEFNLRLAGSRYIRQLLGRNV